MVLSCLSLCASWAPAQSELRLLADSTVEGITYHQLQQWAAFRLVRDRQVRERAWEVARQGRLIGGLQAEVAAGQQAMEAQGLVEAELVRHNAGLRQRAAAADAQAQRLRPWATAGKLATGTVLLGLVLLLANAGG